VYKRQLREPVAGPASSPGTGDRSVSDLQLDVII